MSVEYSKSGKVLIKCNYDEESVIVPEGVTQIRKEAFKDCVNLKEVILPESLIRIGAHAFEGCSSLKRIVIPSGIRSIFRDTFWNCTALEEVVFPEQLEKIGEYAFGSCESLQKITIPDNVESVGAYAFCRCPNLKEAEYHNLKIHMDFTDWRQCSYFKRVINFIRMPVLWENIVASVKYNLLWQMFFQNPDDEKLKDYIRQYFSKIFLNLLDKDDAVSVQKVLDDYDFISKNNIDRFIRYAIDKQKLQSQLLLMNYKASQNWQKQKNLFL